MMTRRRRRQVHRKAFTDYCCSVRSLAEQTVREESTFFLRSNDTLHDGEACYCFFVFSFLACDFVEEEAALVVASAATVVVPYSASKCVSLLFLLLCRLSGTTVSCRDGFRLPPHTRQTDFVRVFHPKRRTSQTQTPTP